MNLITDSRGDVLLVTVKEARIDAASAIQFKDTMRNVPDSGEKRIVLDISEVTYLDSSGLGAIVAAMKHFGSSRPLEISGPTPTVAKVFRLTRMDTIFKIYPDLDAAMSQAA